MFELPILADIKPTKQAIIDNVSRKIMPVADTDAVRVLAAKNWLADSAAFLLGEKLRDVLSPHYASAVDMANMLGDDPVAEVEKVFGQPAGSLGELVTLKLAAYLPAAGDEGKWLAKFGIIDKDWYALAGVEHDPLAIAEAFKREPPLKLPTPPVTEPVAETEEVEVLPPAIPAPPPIASASKVPELVEQYGAATTTIGNAPATPIERPVPTSSDEIDVHAAVKAFATAMDHNAASFAELMGVSRTTAANWLAGKPINKIKAEQIEALRNDLQKRYSLLGSALVALS